MAVIALPSWALVKDQFPVSVSLDTSSNLDAPAEFPWNTLFNLGGHGAGVGLTTHLPIQVITPPAFAGGAMLAPTFVDDFYNRIHVRPGRIDLGNLLSSQTRAIEVWNAYFTGKLLSSIANNGLDGIDLAQPVPTPTTFGAQESRIYTVSISTSGSPVINGNYVFNFPSEAPKLFITGRRVVIWPFVPQTKFRETLQWMTDVMQAYSAEQRLALRTAPRQQFQYEFQLTPLQYSRAKAIATQWAHRVYGVPVWAEATRLGALAAGLSSLTFDTTTGDYRANDILLIWESDTKMLAAETLAVSAGSVALKLPTDQAFSNAYVMPLRFARTLNGAEFTRDAHTVTRARVQFLVNNNVDLGASVGYPQYRGKDVMMDRSVVISDMSERIMRAVEIFDNGSGPVTIDQERAFVDRTEMLTLDALTPQEAWRNRKWLHARRGRQKTFWLPGWNNDLSLVQNVGTADTGIIVRPIGYPLYYGIQDVMVVLNNGTVRYNRVLSGATNGDGNEVLSLSSNFGVAFTPADVAVFCFMKHVRLDADQAELTHDYAGRMSTSLPVIEVPEGD
ncbi:putative virion structural protein [Stenotrophomonas phage A1432]|uniref:Virion structural protein n=1 Tax=Stenotrophomonas phage A1432 TaxID=2930315 RepID=A0A9E7N2S0_9CAUD|nr:putative virion structural protein [Stenotrophomonas phage A1432]UTC27978.1 putative virion structural protein [Stenotrophomonas phage A1432]